MGTLGSFLGARANLRMLCTSWFFFNVYTLIVLEVLYQYNTRYVFNFIDHLHFYSCEWLCR
jgi:hypothetical protein